MALKMTSLKLAQAIDILNWFEIKKQSGLEVTGIEFEDGSGYKFNYHLDCGKWQFIDFSRVSLRAYYFEAETKGSKIVKYFD